MSQTEVLEQPVPSPERGPHVQDSPEAVPAGEGIVRRAGRFVFSWLPSVLVVAALGGLAWFGHHNDWKLPKFGGVAGDTANVGPEWCDSHGVPENDCIVCKAGLIEDTPKLTYCREHGVHGCVLCNPELAQTKEPTKPTAEDLGVVMAALTIGAWFRFGPQVSP